MKGARSDLAVFEISFYFSVKYLYNFLNASSERRLSIFTGNLVYHFRVLGIEMLACILSNILLPEISGHYS